MQHAQIYDVVIIGAGPAGISAAIWCQRLGLHTLLLEQQSTSGGQLHDIHNPIIDYPGMITQNGKELSAQFSQHIHELGIAWVPNTIVTTIATQTNVYHIVTNDRTYRTKYVVVATGTKERRLHIPGEQELHTRGEIYSSSKDLHLFAGKRVLIVGGGDRALEGVCNIAPKASSVLLIHRSTQFRARKEFLQTISQFHNVTVKTTTVVEEIQFDGSKKYVSLLHLNDRQKEIVEVDYILIRVGRVPVDHFLPTEIKRNKSGALQVDANGRTSLQHIFAIGDVVNPPMFSSIATSVGQGMLAARAIALDLQSHS